MDTAFTSPKTTTGRTIGAPEPATPDIVPRPLSTSEWDWLRERFPSLVRQDVVVTGEETGRYNCIAFSMGHDDRWIEPDSPLIDFQVQYQNADFTVTDRADGTVDGWGSPSSGASMGQHMKHASRLSPESQYSGKGLWESKLGSYLRITHGRDQLVSRVYGNILTSFTPAPAPNVRLPDMEPELTAEERRRLHRAAADRTADVALSGEFARRREAFLAAAAASCQSLAAAFTELPEFAELIALGEGIVPLVIAQLDEPEGFLLLGVLDALAPSIAAVDYDPLTGLQSRARLIARSWLADH